MIGLNKDMGVPNRGVLRISEKDIYTEKLWTHSTKEIRHTLAQRRSAVGSMIRKRYIGRYMYAEEILINAII